MSNDVPATDETEDTIVEKLPFHPVDYSSLIEAENEYEDFEIQPMIINSTPSPFRGENDFLFSRFLPEVQESEKAIEAIQNLQIETIAHQAGIHGDNVAVESFLTSLKDAYLLMVKSIMERHNETYHRAPGNYPEFDIYDSVHGIIEGEEFDELTEAFREDSGHTVSEVSSVVYKIMDDLFCGISKWNDSKRNEPKDVPSLY